MRAKALRGDRTVALPGATVVWDGQVLGRTDEAGFLAAEAPGPAGRIDSLEVVAPGFLRRTYIVETNGSDYAIDVGGGYLVGGSWPYLSFDQAVLPEVQVTTAPIPMPIPESAHL